MQGKNFSTNDFESKDKLARRVFVKNLDKEITQQELRDHLKRSGGNIVNTEILEDLDGQPKGCGVVEFSTAEEAKDAIKRLNQSELFGRTITVEHEAL